MNIKNRITAAAATATAVVGLLVGFGASQVYKPTKTVTKTKTKVVQIENGASPQRVLALLGRPANVASDPNVPGFQCALYVGKLGSDGNPTDWYAMACFKTK